MWFGTNASVPAGWTKYATANDRAFSGAESSLGTQAGSDTHTHTGGSHAWAGNTHSHDASSNYHNSATAPAKGTLGKAVAAVVTHNISPAGHFHPAATSPTESVSPYASASLGTISTENHLPPSTTCILIHPTTGTKDLPDDASVFLDSGTLPSGFTWHDGVGVAIDLTDKFVKGVNDSATDNGGGSDGQTNHTHTTAAHNHAGASHTHGNFSAGGAATAGTVLGVGKGGDELFDVHHTISLAATTPGVTGFRSPSSVAKAIEPPYVKLRAAQNTSGADKAETGMIVLYKGASPASVANWDLCDGTGGTQDMDGKYAKVTNTTGDIGNTGGTSTHTHTSDFQHVHTIAFSHNHTVNFVSELGKRKILVGTFSSFVQDSSHAGGDHTTWTVTSTSPTGQTESVTPSTDSHLPKHVTLAFLKYNPSTGVKIVSLGGVYQTGKVVLVG